MMRITASHILALTLSLAILVAGLMPLAKLSAMPGMVGIELCSRDGVTIIAVPADALPGGPDTGVPLPGEAPSHPDCMACFAAGMLAKALTAPASAPVPGFEKPVAIISWKRAEFAATAAHLPPRPPGQGPPHLS